MSRYWTEQGLEQAFTAETLPEEISRELQSEEARLEMLEHMRFMGFAARVSAMPEVDEAAVERVSAAVLSIYNAIRNQREDPWRLAADSGSGTLATIGDEVGVHALFVDLATGKGYIRALRVELVAGDRLAIFPHHSTQCDAVMQAAVQRAFNAVIDELTSCGFAIPETGQAVVWRIGNDDDPPAVFSGASIGLALAVAVGALLTGTPVPYELAVSGAVDGHAVFGVRGVAEKFAAVARQADLANVVIPEANMLDLPPSARSSRRPRAQPVATLREALSIVMGVALGIGRQRLAADTSASSSPQASIHLDLWVDADDSLQEVRSRSVGSPAPARPPETFYLCDHVSLGLWASADCHFLLINKGTSGKISCVAPSTYLPTTKLVARQKYFIRNCPLNGPIGREELIALVTQGPVHEALPDLLAVLNSGTATMVDVLAAMNHPAVLGRVMCQFIVEPRAEASVVSRGMQNNRPNAPAKRRWLAIDLDAG